MNDELAAGDQVRYWGVRDHRLYSGVGIVATVFQDSVALTRHAIDTSGYFSTGTIPNSWICERWKKVPA